MNVVILLVMSVVGNGMSVSMQEFNSKASCEEAKELIMITKGASGFGSVVAKCIRK